YISKNVENAWQYSKVYRQHADEHGEPTERYWEWAVAGWNNPRAQRYPAGKGVKPLYSLWDEKHVDYIEAKKTIYVPLYCRAVVVSKAFEKLKQIYETFGEIVLWDFDAYDHRSLAMDWDD